MSSRERHTLRLRQQVQDKIRSLIDQKEFLCDLVDSYVTEAKSQAEQLLLTEDAGQFTDQYVDIMQQLDRCYKTCVLLAASAEDLIEGAGPKIPGNQENTKTYEESQRPAFRECGPAPNQDMSSAKGSAAKSSFSVDILGSSDNCRPGGKLSSDMGGKLSPDMGGKLSSDLGCKQGFNGPDITSDGYTPGTSETAKGNEIDLACNSPVKRNMRNNNRLSLSPFSKYETEIASSQYNRDHKTEKRNTTELSCSKHDKSVSIHSHSDQEPSLKSSAEMNPSKEGDAGVTLTTEGGSDVMLSQDVCPKVPRIRRASLPSGKGTVVIVTEVFTPWYFYVQQINTEFKRLMEEICYYMQTTGMSSACIKNVSVGMMCLAPYPKDNVYYRAIIVRIIDNSQDVDIMFIDYGDQTRMQTGKLRTIPERFTDVPAQAICCALAGVMPSNKYCIWTEADVMYFSQYVRNHQLSCIPVCCSSDPTFPHIVELILHFPMSVVGQEQMIMSSQINLSVLFLSKKSVQKIVVSEQMSKMGKSLEVTRNAEVKMLLEQIFMQDSKGYDGSSNPDHQPKIREIDETEATGTILRSAADKTVSSVVEDSLAKMSDSDKRINESKSLESNTPIKIEEDKTYRVERLVASYTPAREETFPPVKDKNEEVAVVKWKENHSERQELKDVYKLQQGVKISSILEESQDKNIQKASEDTKAKNKSVLHPQGKRLLTLKEMGTDRTEKMSEVRKPKTEFPLSVERKNHAKKPKGKGSTKDIKKELNIQSEAWKVDSSETWQVDNEPTLGIVKPEESQSESKKTMPNRSRVPEEQLSKKEVSSSELVRDKAQDEDSGLEGDSVVDTETGQDMKYRERPDSRHSSCTKSSNTDDSRCPLFRDGSEMKESTGCEFATIRSVDTFEETNVDGEAESHVKTEHIDSETADSITSSDSAKISTGVPSSKDQGEVMFSSAKLNVNAQRYDVMMSHVNSPSDFYVHLVSRQTGQTIERIMSGLKKHYGDMKGKKLQKLAKSFMLEKEKLCCAQYPVDGSYYRARIIDICESNAVNENDPNIGKVHVFYLDFGNDEWLPKRKIFPLPEEFAQVPQLTIHCSLAYIKPVSDNQESEAAKSSSGVWSKEDRDLLIQLTGCGKKLQMHVVHGCLSGDISGELLTNSGSSSVKVLLVNNSEDEEVCLNMDLIRLGRATVDLSHLPLEKAACEEDQQAIKSWNPMAEDFFAIRNSYQVDTNDPGVATVGYKANDERIICKFFSTKTPGNCLRGDRCPYKHIEVTGAVTQDKKEVFASVHESQLEMMPEVGCWVAVEVTTILNPGHFYINLPFGKKSLDGKYSCSTSEEGYGSFMEDTETLADLMEAMNEHYSKKSLFEDDLIYRALGEIVAAKFSQDGQWYRARVISVSETMVKVFYLDFGNTEKVDRKDIYEMQPQFMLLPFQAVECLLYNAEPANNQEFWSQDARKYFRELVDRKTLVAYVPCSTRERLFLVLYDTTTEEDIDIGEALIQRGYAQPRQALSAPSSVPSSSRSSSSSLILIPG